MIDAAGKSVLSLDSLTTEQTTAGETQPGSLGLFDGSLLAIDHKNDFFRFFFFCNVCCLSELRMEPVLPFASTLGHFGLWRLRTVVLHTLLERFDKV